MVFEDSRPRYRMRVIDVVCSESSGTDYRECTYTDHGGPPSVARQRRGVTGIHTNVPTEGSSNLGPLVLIRLKGPPVVGLFGPYVTGVILH